MTVEVDAYSGRPNLRWTLSDEEQAAVLARLSSLPAVKARAAQRGMQ